MDPVTHTLTGAALGRAGLGKGTPLARAALMLAANAPDIDILSYVNGPYAALAFRRGWTHGPLGLLLLPPVVVALLLAWDRRVRRCRRPELQPARPLPLLGPAYLAIATHPALDWLNIYGMRWLMPFDGSWSYGDALFIVDPWVWLALGGPLFLAGSVRRGAQAGWAVLAGLGSLLVLAVPGVPLGARLLWLAAVAGLALLRVRQGAAWRDNSQRLIRWAAGAVVVYIGAMIGLSAAGRSQIRAALDELGIGPVEEIMVAPQPADPFRRYLVVATPTAYHRGTLDWLANPRVRMRTDSLPRLPAAAGFEQAEAVIHAATRAPAARDYLTWARFPFFHVQQSGNSYAVSIGDARYAEGPAGARLQGPVIRVVIPPGAASPP